MHHAIFFPTFCFYGLLFACAGALFATPFFKPMCAAPHWMRRALWGAGVAMICAGVLNWLVVFRGSQFSRLGLSAMQVSRTVFCGATLALLILLYASADYWRIYRDHKLAKQRQTRQQSTPVL